MGVSRAGGNTSARAARTETVEGSTKQYTPQQIDDLLNPPDWFPEAHKPAPGIVQKGHGGALACGACHLMSGFGHPESADLTGFTADYFVQQMNDFKAGTRKDYARMNGIAKELSDEEIRQAAEWFASLPRGKFIRVVEAAMVPKTFVGQGRMRFVDPEQRRHGADRQPDHHAAGRPDQGAAARPALGLRRLRAARQPVEGARARERRRRQDRGVQHLPRRRA